MTKLYTLPNAKQKLAGERCMAYGHDWRDDRRFDGTVSIVFCENGCGLSLSFPEPTRPPEVPVVVVDEPEEQT